jgi:hypothetical protein
VCRTCKRVNPVEAVFCHYDGATLEGHPANGRPAPSTPGGQRPFHSPFVFPSGRSCRTFDELVLTCEASWAEARDLVRQGFLVGFMGGLGRADLAQAAQQAAGAADPDRALDEFLGKLPCSARKPRKLEVRPPEIDLGRLPRDHDYRVYLDLANAGMGLVSGTISSDCDWLMVGDGAGSAEKLIQFRDTARVPVRVISRNLRAGAKQLEGRLTVETNGGTVVIVVRADVPVKPFPSGVLAGALTPREVAQRAKANIKGAAPWFERGEVEQWYRDNGWIYPVQGPAFSGIHAIQQFFEALGLVVPPKVEINVSSITLRGAPGAKLDDEIEVSAEEKKPVFAHGVTSTAWLQVDRAILSGRTARIPVRVPSVPDKPGERLLGRIEITANGGQHFHVDVTLIVTGTPIPVVELVDEPELVPVVPVFEEPEPVRPVVRGGTRNDTEVPAQSDNPFADLDEPDPEPVREMIPPRPREVVQTRPVDPFADIEQPAQDPDPVPERDRGRDRDQDHERDRPRRGGMGWHLLPLGFLLLCLMGAGFRDLLLGVTTPPPVVIEDQPPAEPPLDPRPRITLHFHDTESNVTLGKAGLKPVGGMPDPAELRPAFWEPSMRFGVHILNTIDIKRPGQPKRLNFRDDGTTNNSVVRLDGQEIVFGDRPFREVNGKYAGDWPGHWVADQRDVKIPPTENSIEGRRSVWVYDAQRVEITQTAEIVRGPQSYLLDTVLVRYRLHNKDNRPHNVGIRFLLDTFIGSNDGVPFLIPGADRLCSTQKEFATAQQVPDFIQALENEDLANPGTIAQVGFRVGPGIEPPNRVTLGAWPNVAHNARDPRCRQEKTLWEVPLLDIHTLEPGDSAVTIYWDEKLITAGQKREVGFTYGLGHVSGGEGSGKLALTVGGSFVPHGEFTLTAYVSNPLPGQTVTLRLPDGFSLQEGKLVVPVPPLPTGATSRNSPVTWKIRGPSAEGRFPLKVTSSTGVEQTQMVKIRTRGIFGE